MRRVALAFLGFVTLQLTACGTSSPTSFYTLDDAGFDFTPDRETAYVLGIGPVRVPEYLERPHMVTRGKGAELRVDDFDRWAEPISQAHHRIIALNVDSLLDGIIVVGFPYGPVIDYDAKLVGRIGRFDMDTTGTTRLAVFWTIASIDGDVLVEPTRHEYVETGGDPDDPDSIATAMSACLTQFSQDVAAAMRALDDAGALVPASSPVP